MTSNTTFTDTKDAFQTPQRRFSEGSRVSRTISRTTVLSRTLSGRFSDTQKLFIDTTDAHQRRFPEGSRTLSRMLPKTVS